jgi:hypothetical protein
VPRILFDVNVPRPAARFLTGHTVEFADRRGWRELTNGALLAAAEQDGFDVLVTTPSSLHCDGDSSRYGGNAPVRCRSPSC